MIRRTVIPIIYFFSLSILLFLPVFTQRKIPINSGLMVSFYEPWKSTQGSISYKPLGFDDVKIFYPERIFTVDRLRSGHLPVWDPYIFTGNVHLANSQTAVFYPLFWIFLVLSPTTSWVILSMSIPFLSGFFMYWFLARKVSHLAALFGSSVFALSGVIIVRTQDGIVAGHSAIWLPLVFLAVDYIASNKKNLGTLLFIASMSLSIFAGWFQYSFYILVFAFAYALYRRVPFGRILLIYLLTVLLTGVHLYPAVQALLLSPRGDGQTLDLAKHLMAPWHTITYFVSDFFGHPANYTYFGKSEYKEGMLYVGIWPFIFSLVAFWRSKQSRVPKFFMISGLMTLFLGLDVPGLAGILKKLPLVSAFLPNRIFLLNTFALTVASAYGLDMLFNRTKIILTIKWVCGLLGGILILLTVGILGIYINEKILINITKFSFFQLGLERYLLLILVSVRESFLALTAGAITVFLLARKKINIVWFMAGIITLTVAHQLVFASRYLYFSDPKNLFPANQVISFLQDNTRNDYSRFVTLGDAHFTANTSLYYKLYDVEGVDALYPTWYGEFMGFVQSQGQSLNVQDRISTWFAPTITKQKDWHSPFVINFLNLTGVKYLVTNSNFAVSPPNDRYTLAYSADNMKVWQYNSFTPKVKFVSNFEIIPDKKSQLRRLFESNFDPSKSAVLFKNPGFQSTKKGTGEASLSYYSPEKVVVTVNALSPGLVILNDNYYPNWRASVDGVVTTIYRANYTFRAVSVESGRHIIVMDFDYLNI